jgi:hypothetical protein
MICGQLLATEPFEINADLGEHVMYAALDVVHVANSEDLVHVHDFRYSKRFSPLLV